MSNDIRQSALNYLARRDHTRYELNAKLVAKGFCEQQVAVVLDALEHSRLLSDLRFVESYIQSRMKRGFGPAFIRRELGRYGAEPALVEDCFVGLDIDWQPVLERLWQRKFADLLDEPKLYAKQCRFLLQRGFSPDSVHKLLHRKKGDQIA